MSTRCCWSVVALVAVCGVGSARAATFIWTGSCGTINWGECCVDTVPPPFCTYFNNWSNSPGGCAGGCLPLPGSGDDVVVGIPAIVIESGLADCRSLMCAGTCTIPGTAFRAATTATFGGLLTLDSGSIAGGALTLNGGLLITDFGALIYGGAQVHMAANSTWNPNAISANFLIEGAASLINNAGVTFDATGDGTVSGGGAVSAFTNTGVFRKTGGTGITQIGVGMTNTGRIEAQTGTIQVSGESSLGGVIDISADARFRLINVGTALSGLTFTGAGTFDIQSEFNIPVGITASAPIVETTGEIGGGGAFNISGALRAGGTFDGGITTVLSSGTMTVVPGMVLSEGHSLRNAGIGVVEAGVFYPTGGELRNLAGGTMTLNDGVVATTCCAQSGGVIVNEGAMTAAAKAGGNNVAIGVPMSNAGTLIIPSGILQVNQLTQTAGETRLSGGRLRTVESFELQDGVLSGSGIVQGVVNNSGAVVSPGPFAGLLEITPLFTASYTQGGKGRLEIELGGTAPGTQHDQLSVAGDAVLDGTLAVTLINGFHPILGQEFTILTGSSVTGQFTLNSLPPGMAVQYTATSVIVSQVTPPCPADANGDNGVNGADLSVLLSQFGQSVTPGSGADFNVDGLVNAADLSVLLSNFGATC